MYSVIQEYVNNYKANLPNFSEYLVFLKTILKQSNRGLECDSLQAINNVLCQLQKGYCRHILKSSGSFTFYPVYKYHQNTKRKFVPGLTHTAR